MNTATRQETDAVQALAAYPVAELPREATSTSALVLDAASMDSMMRVAELMASGRSTVPAHLQKNPADCMAVVMQSMQWRMNPFAVAQKTHLVSGTLGYEAQLVNAVINTMAPTKDRIHYEWFGPWERIVGKFKTIVSKTKMDESGRPKEYRVPAWEAKDEEGLGVRVWATLKGETEPRELTLLMAQARTRNSTLWADDPKQQIGYLAVKRWARLYTPDVILGVYTPDEFDEPQPKNMGAAEVIRQDVPVALQQAAKEAAAKGVAAYQKFWADTGADNRKLLAELHPGLKQQAIDADRSRTVDTPATAAPAPVASATADQDPPAVTYASVMDKLLAAKNLDALFVAADWIAEVPEPGQRDELNAKFEELQAKFGG